MYRLVTYLHNSIDNNIINDIINIKSNSWPFSYESQLNWIKKNLTEGDIHCLLYDNDKLIAYANLVNEHIQIDGINTKMLGIGNVCTYEKGKGRGSILIKKINDYLKRTNTLGLLFCKESLAKFYAKNNWEIIEPSKLEIQGLSPTIVTMGYNLPSFKKIRYSNRLF